MRTRLLIDALTIYQHSRDTLRGLEHGGRTTGGLFGTVKTVDAMLRKYKPEVVVLCFGESDVRVGDPRFAEQDAFDLLYWAKVHGFYSTYLKAGNAADTINKVSLDMLGSREFDRLVIQTWDPSLRMLTADERVELVTKIDEPVYTHVNFVADHGVDAQMFLSSRQFLSGDLVTVTPTPDRKALRVWLSDFGFKSVTKELDQGKVKVIERKGILL